MEVKIKPEPKNVAALSLSIIGGITTVVGLFKENTGLVNMGLAGLFLGVVVFAFKRAGYVKRDALTSVMNSYRELLKRIVLDLGLEGNAVYIPPYENLPDGGTFIPLREDFILSLGKLDEETVFLTNVSSEREMGLSIRPTGSDLVKMFEDYSEGPLEGIGPEGIENVAGAVLRSLNLVKGVYIEENEDRFKIIVRPDFPCNPKDCEQVACPVCSSILLALAKSTGQLIESESFERKDYGIEIQARKLGGVKEWM